MQKLRVRVSGTAMVQDFERLEAGKNAFIGRKYTETSPGKWEFVPTNEVIEVPSRAEYLKALRDGDLAPADEPTATAAGLKLPPNALRRTEPTPSADTKSAVAEALASGKVVELRHPELDHPTDSDRDGGAS